MSIKSRAWVEDNNLPLSAYYEQFDRPTLEVGKIYLQPGPVYWKHYQIVYIGHGVALGVEIANGNNNFAVGSKSLFFADPVKSGFGYPGAAYRLTQEVKG